MQVADSAVEHRNTKRKMNKKNKYVKKNVVRIIIGLLVIIISGLLGAIIIKNHNMFAVNWGTISTICGLIFGLSELLHNRQQRNIEKQRLKLETLQSERDKGSKFCVTFSTY